MFDAAARHLNFRLAAEELHLTQGAVAQQVRKLEAELGKTLFRRKPRGLALTEIGRSYHASISPALQMIDDATRKLVPESSRIAVSATPSFASKWLVPRLSKFAASHPDVEVQIIASEELANFRGDGVDVAIRLGSPPFGSGLHVQRMAALQLCAVCSPGMASKMPAIKSPAELSNYPLVRDSHNHWDLLLKKGGPNADRRSMRFNQTALAIDAASNGQGIALTPRLLVERELALGHLASIWRDPQPSENGYYAVWPDNRKNNRARDAFVEWIRAETAADDDSAPSAPGQQVSPEQTGPSATSDQTD